MKLGFAVLSWLALGAAPRAQPLPIHVERLDPAGPPPNHAVATTPGAFARPACPARRTPR
jgi:hypothetical protein